MPTPWPVSSDACAHQPVVALVVLVAAVAHVEPGDVHAGVDELADPLRGADGRAEGADDLGSTHDLNPSEPWIVPSDVARSVRRQSDDERTRGRRDRRRAAPVEPVRYSSTPAAAARPSAIAHTISDWPRPQSPATNTPSTEEA